MCMELLQPVTSEPWHTYGVAKCLSTCVLCTKYFCPSTRDRIRLPFRLFPIRYRLIHLMSDKFNFSSHKFSVPYTKLKSNNLFLSGESSLYKGIQNSKISITFTLNTFQRVKYVTKSKGNNFWLCTVMSYRLDEIKSGKKTLLYPQQININKRRKIKIKTFVKHEAWIQLIWC